MTLARAMSALALGALAVALIVPPAARAAQDTTVVEDNAPVRAEPNSSAKIVEYLELGAEVRISRHPMPGGWFKVRSRTGVYGWVHESFLSVGKPIQPFAVEEEDQGPVPERDRKWFLRGGIGLDFFSPADLNDIFRFTDLDRGFLWGGEIGYFVRRRVSIAFRADFLSTDVVTKETSSGLIFNLGIRSYPVMLGLDFYFANLPAWKLSLGLFGGIALATSFSSEALSVSTPNTFVLEEAPFTGLARLNLTRPLGRILSVYIEGGYRLLKTTGLDTAGASSVNGGQIYVRNNAFVAREIDLSGFYGTVGVGIHL